MTTREKILEAVRRNQPELSPLPDISNFQVKMDDPVSKYTDVFTGIGGFAIRVSSKLDIIDYVKNQFPEGKRMVTVLDDLEELAERCDPGASPHSFEDVELAIIGSDLAVAENGAVWLTESNMGHRILPYICQHLAVVIQARGIVPTMHDAYSVVGAGGYGFGGFIGGPSKTADIEQALVLGAHGPLSMTVFILDDF